MKLRSNILFFSGFQLFSNPNHGFSFPTIRHEPNTNRRGKGMAWIVNGLKPLKCFCIATVVSSLLLTSRMVIAIDVTERLEIAKQYYILGDYEQTVAELEKIISALHKIKISEKIEAYKYLAFGYIALGDLEKGKKMFERVLRLNPDMVLNPVLISPKIIQIFEEAKNELMEEGEEYKMSAPISVSPLVSSSNQKMAVLPFRNTSKREEYNWLGEAIADALVDGLRNIEYFIIIDRPYIKKTIKNLNINLSSRTIENELPKIGRYLVTNIIIVGSYQLLEDNIRIIAKFVEVETGKIIFSTKVSGKLQDLFVLQDQMYEAVLANLNLNGYKQLNKKILQPKPSDITPYKYYITGLENYYLSSPQGYMDAVTQFENALKLDERYALAWSGLAQAYAAWGFYKEQRGEESSELYEKAFEAGKKAAGLNPKFTEVYRALAFCYLQIGDFDNAKKEAMRALSHNSLDAESWEILALTNPTGDENWALDKLKKAIELNPRLYSAHIAIGNFYTSKKKYDDALLHYNEAFKINPLSEEVYYVNMGVVYKNQSNYDEAIRHFQKALALNPNCSAAYNNLGIVYHLRKDLKMAIDNYHLAIKANPRSIGARLNIAKALLEIDRTEEAVTELKEALKYNPQDFQEEEIKKILDLIKEKK